MSAYENLLGSRLDPRRELLENRLVHENSRSSRARLSSVLKDAQRSPGDRLLEVGGGEDDVGTLAAELQRNAFEVRLGRRDRDEATRLRRAGEGNLVDVHVFRQRDARLAAQARQNVKDSSREPRLIEQLRELHRRE